MIPPSPRGLLTAIALSILPVVGGCGEPKVHVADDGETVVTSPDGMVIQTAEDGASLSAPDDLPAYAPAYPGARLATRIRGGETGEGSLMVFETGDPLPKVAAFYDEQARKAGVKSNLVVSEGESAVRIFGNPKGGGEGVVIAISRSKDEPLTEIVITAGMAEADMAEAEQEPDAWRERVRMPARLQ